VVLWSVSTFLLTLVREVETSSYGRGDRESVAELQAGSGDSQGRLSIVLPCSLEIWTGRGRGGETEKVIFLTAPSSWVIGQAHAHHHFV